MPGFSQLPCVGQTADETSRGNHEVLRLDPSLRSFASGSGYAAGAFAPAASYIPRLIFALYEIALVSCEDASTTR